MSHTEAMVQANNILETLRNLNNSEADAAEIGTELLDMIVGDDDQDDLHACAIELSGILDALDSALDLAKPE